MKKEGVIYDTIFLYILASLVMVSIFVFGFYAISGISERQCAQDVMHLEGLLKDRISEMDNAKSTFRKERIPIGCGAEKVYFIDKREKVDSFFVGETIINNSISDDAKNNIFVMRADHADDFGKEAVFGMSIDRLDIPFPYFTCTYVREGHIDVIIESTSYGTSVINHDFRLDCGFWEYLEEIVREVWPDEDPERKTRLLLHEIEENMGKIDESREFISVPGTDKTEVVVTLKAKEDIDSLHHFEMISKCLAAHVDEISFILPPDIIINEDPLLMWEFEDISEEEEIVIRYTVEKEIDEMCKVFVRSLSESISGGRPEFNQLYLSQKLDVASIIDQEVQEQNDDLIGGLSEVDESLANIEQPPPPSESSSYYKKIMRLEYKISIIEDKISYLSDSIEEFRSKYDVDDEMENDWFQMIDGKIDLLTYYKSTLEQRKAYFLQLYSEES